MSPLVLAAAVSWMDPASVAPRQKGVCITEWTGGQRVEIPVEVLGVLDAPAPERNAVLVRLVDDRFKDSGVVAGMSGSPVYIDGKLLGAVAFGWAFAQEPLAGITPFSAMKELKGGGQPINGTPPTVSQLVGLVNGSVEPAAVLPKLPTAPHGALTPVALGGFAGAGDFGRTVLSSAGLTPVPAGSALELEGLPEAGEMVAAMLVWGDATIAAGGTVTARDGDQVWAFGHPLMSLGGVTLPAARARTIAVQDSYQTSFKVFGVGKAFGTFVADRPAGILAVAGEPPQGLPVTITLDEAIGKGTWNFRVAQVPVLEPLLITYLTNASLTARGAGTGDSTARVVLDMRFSDGRSARVTQTIAGPDALARIAAFTGAVVGFVGNSQFARPDLSAVDIHLERRERLETASIVEVLPERTIVRPGERVRVQVRLAPYQQPEVTVPMTLTVPPDAKPGAIDLIVADGAAWSDYRLKSKATQPRDFAAQLEMLGSLEPNATLVAALERRERGVAARGASQESLPPSYAATLAIGLGRSNIARTATSVAEVARWSAPHPLEGAFRIPLQVRAPRSEPLGAEDVGQDQGAEVEATAPENSNDPEKP